MWLPRALLVASVLIVLDFSQPLVSAEGTTPELPSGVQDVVKLVKAGLGEDVVLAHIKSLDANYNLTADQLIYLHQQGVSQNEIKALMSTGNSTPTSPVAPAPVPTPANAPQPIPQTAIQPPPAVGTPSVAPAPVVPAAPFMSGGEPPSLDGFQAQLAPYGRWSDVPGYGPCWRPAIEVGSPYWRPYCDGGNWVYTDEGWTWQSDYPWGNIVFHYGRWYRDNFGWVWVPGYDWAPAWVCWRQADGYCGWAALPPAAVFRPGIGLWYGGHLAVDVDFGLGVDAFTFVAYDHFWEHNLHAWLLPRERLTIVFGHSVIMNGYRLEHGRFVVEGLGRGRMAALTHHEIRVEATIGHDVRSERRMEHEHAPIREEHRDHRGR